jgi:hypothetical protein
MIVPICIVLGIIIAITLTIVVKEDAVCGFLASVALGVAGFIVGLIISATMIGICPYTTIDSYEYDLIPVAENTYWVNNNEYKSYNDINVYYKNENNETHCIGIRAEDLIFVEDIDTPYIQIQTKDIENPICRTLSFASDGISYKVYVPAYTKGVTE